MADDEEDDEGLEGLYENGYWEWDEALGGLVFLRYELDEEPRKKTLSFLSPAVVTGGLDFKDNIDLIEQVRFRRRYARKPEPDQHDVITLQDVKDLVLYTAPVGLLSPMIINLLHVPTTERFLRALILYCQYYLQVHEMMSARRLELEKKLRTPVSDEVEALYRDNLRDLRGLVAKEYSILTIGAAETNKFHHMGPQKILKSLTDKDANLFETLLKFSIQIVWIALTRKDFDKIEIEVHRMFKSDIFNSAEHKHSTLIANLRREGTHNIFQEQEHKNSKLIAKMSRDEANIFQGHCLRTDSKLKGHSPLMDELKGYNGMDFRLVGLGTIKYEVDELTSRLNYLLLALTCPESQLAGASVSLGILGLPRTHFDTMLRVLPTAFGSNTKRSGSKLPMVSSFRRSKSASRSASATSVSSSTPGRSKQKEKLIYANIALPEKSSFEPPIPECFPEEPMPRNPCNEQQRQRWHQRLQQLLHPPKKTLPTKIT